MALWKHIHAAVTAASLYVSTTFTCPETKTFAQPRKIPQAQPNRMEIRCEHQLQIPHLNLGVNFHQAILAPAYVWTESFNLIWSSCMFDCCCARRWTSAPVFCTLKCLYWASSTDQSTWPASLSPLKKKQTPRCHVATTMFKVWTVFSAKHKAKEFIFSLIWPEHILLLNCCPLHGFEKTNRTLYGFHSTLRISGVNPWFVEKMTNSCTVNWFSHLSFGSLKFLKNYHQQSYNHQNQVWLSWIPCYIPWFSKCCF